MQKRKKKHLKRSIKLLLFLILIILIGTISYQYFYKQDNIKKVMKEYNIDEKYYSKTLEYVLLNNIYDEAYLEEYQDIEYNNETNFSSILTTFLPLGYSGQEINYLLKLSSKNIAYLQTVPHQDIKNYYLFKNFDASKLERYNEYKDNNDVSYQDAITRVNIKLDLPVYTDTTTVDDANDLLVLVNKYNNLPSGYKPDDLVYLDGAYGNKVPMREVIKDSFIKLQKQAQEETGMNLMPSTAYRSESLQTQLYNNYVASDGKEKADTYSARPGYSEHQTGLAIDLRNTNLGTTGTRLTDDDYKWLYDNSYKYGFIIRFPEDKVDITGYQFENWHIRYVGNEAAKIIHDNNLCLEEYTDLYITQY